MKMQKLSKDGVFNSVALRTANTVLLSSVGLNCLQLLNIFGTNYEKLVLPMKMQNHSKDGLLNPTALRMAKTLWSFGHSECSRVKLLTVFEYFCNYINTGKASVAYEDAKVL